MVTSGSTFGLLVAVLLAGAGPAAADQILVLEVETFYGRAGFKRCQTEIVLNVPHELYSIAASCVHGDRSGSTTRFERPLSGEEAAELRDLVAAAELFSVPHVGRDETPGDGLFITVKLRSIGRAVVVVASGNPAFDEGRAPSALLRRVLALQFSGIEKARTASSAGDREPTP